MMRVLTIILALMLLPCLAHPQKRQRTTRPRAELRHDTAALQTDTIALCRLDSIILSGYDKPLRSRRESLFVTNRTGRYLTGLQLTIDYRDNSGRQLHERTAEIRVDIPSGQTRMVTFPSWDRQQAFVYIHSVQPPRSRAIPYSVKVRVVRAEAGR